MGNPPILILSGLNVSEHAFSNLQIHLKEIGFDSEVICFTNLMDVNVHYLSWVENIQSRTKEIVDTYGKTPSIVAFSLGSVASVVCESISQTVLFDSVIHISPAFFTRFYIPLTLAEYLPPALIIPSLFSKKLRLAPGISCATYTAIYEMQRLAQEILLDIRYTRKNVSVILQQFDGLVSNTKVQNLSKLLEWNNVKTIKNNSIKTLAHCPFSSDNHAEREIISFIQEELKRKYDSE
jgi:hypothetical protein